MAIRVFKLDEDVWTIALDGRIDGTVARAVQQAFDNLLDTELYRIIADLSDATYLASAGVRVLIAAYRRAQEAGGGVEVVVPPNNVREVMRMAGLEQTFHFNTSVGEALARLKSG